MNKTYFVLFAVFISVVAGFFVTSVYFKKQNEETSTQIVEFVQVTMDSFLSSHDTDYFRQHCSQAYNAILKDSDLAQYLRLPNYLGTYKQSLPFLKSILGTHAPRTYGKNSINCPFFAHFPSI